MKGTSVISSGILYLDVKFKKLACLSRTFDSLVADSGIPHW